MEYSFYQNSMIRDNKNIKIFLKYIIGAASVCMAFLFIVSANKSAAKSSPVHSSYERRSFWAPGMEVLDGDFSGVGELGTGGKEVAIAFNAHSENEFFTELIDLY